MNYLSTTALGVLSAGLLSVASVSAAGIPGTRIAKSSVRGEYMEARNADVYTGACFANAEEGLVGDLAVLGWKIDKGSFEGVKLDGLGVVGVVRAKSTLGDKFGEAYPVKSVLLIDSKADPAQRQALKAFAQRMGGDLLQNVVHIEYQPVDMKVKDGNIHLAEATLTAGPMARISTRALDDGDQICHHEEVWYQPLTKLDHAMPAFTITSSYRGPDLDAQWNTAEKRSAFVGSFHYQD